MTSAQQLRAGRGQQGEAFVAVDILATLGSHRTTAGGRRGGSRGDPPSGAGPAQVLQIDVPCLPGETGL